MGRLRSSSYSWIKVPDSPPPVFIFEELDESAHVGSHSLAGMELACMQTGCQLGQQMWDNLL
eukprot:4041759-Prorocentrum_lima.AAC.1